MPHEFYTQIEQSDVIGLNNSLNGKASSTHTHAPSVITGNSSGSFNINTGTNVDWYLTATANRTLTVTGGSDGQMIVIDIVASGGTRTITLNGITLTAGIVASWAIPSGKVGTLGLRRTNGSWRALAQTVDQ